MLRSAAMAGSAAGARASGLAEEDDRAQERVGRLLGRGDEEAELVPVVGRLATLTAEVGRSVPLDGAGRTALLASLGACIEALCAAEQAAAEALQAAAA